MRKVEVAIRCGTPGWISNLGLEPPQLFPCHSLDTIESPFCHYRNLINYFEYLPGKAIVWLRSNARGATIASSIHKERA
jgi:hypothetical protein